MDLKRFSLLLFQTNLNKFSDYMELNKATDPKVFMDHYSKVALEICSLTLGYMLFIFKTNGVPDELIQEISKEFVENVKKEADYFREKAEAESANIKTDS